MGISLLKAEAVSGKDFSTAVAQLPSIYQEKGLYTGRAFPNDPAATSPEEAATFSKTQVCSQGKVTIPFAQALCRAEMLANNIEFGAYGFNEDGNCIAEWIHNVCFDMLTAQNMAKTANGMPVGEIISVAFDSKTGTFSANVGGKSLDANTFALAPFIFAFWGLFMENADFKDAFDCKQYVRIAHRCCHPEHIQCAKSERNNHEVGPVCSVELDRQIQKIHFVYGQRKR